MGKLGEEELRNFFQEKEEAVVAFFLLEGRHYFYGPYQKAPHSYVMLLLQRMLFLLLRRVWVSKV